MFKIIDLKTGELLFNVAENDFPTLMTLDAGIKACQKLGDGWTLPSKEQMIAIHDQLYKLGQGNFDEKSKYWSVAKNESGLVQYFTFELGQHYASLNGSRGKFKVRAIQMPN